MAEPSPVVSYWRDNCLPEDVFSLAAKELFIEYMSMESERVEDQVYSGMTSKELEYGPLASSHFELIGIGSGITKRHIELVYRTSSTNDLSSYLERRAVAEVDGANYEVTIVKY